jgi:hypothetical protein
VNYTSLHFKKEETKRQQTQKIGKKRKNGEKTNQIKREFLQQIHQQKYAKVDFDLLCFEKNIEQEQLFHPINPKMLRMLMYFGSFSLLQI